ncbi:DUF4307 domain-containing protein [Schumannella soli]|uniref:DUF4307 domain-containing protein n=1 Tax=Schumannella soli TaxID=2590779 RepID=UPI0015E86C5D|nr:DUF4307 domain-containing protein [Schumannella soli]
MSTEQGAAADTSATRTSTPSAPATDASARPASPAFAAALDARYGRSPNRRTNRRILAIVGGVVLAVLVVSWVLWTGILGAKAQLEATDLGHDTTATETTVRWSLTAPVNTEVSCAVEAQNDNHGIVGWKIVRLPASDQQVRQFSETVRTSERAVTGLINRCWLS